MKRALFIACAGLMLGAAAAPRLAAVPAPAAASAEVTTR